MPLRTTWPPLLVTVTSTFWVASSAAQRRSDPGLERQVAQDRARGLGLGEFRAP
jgi:hypothetical protein